MKRRLATTALLAALTAGCASTPPPEPEPEAAAEIRISSGPVIMPDGVDLTHLELIDERRQIRVYTQMKGIDNPSDKTLLFPPEMAAAIGLTNSQVNRSFMDLILSSRRFQVFDDSSTVIRDQARQTIGGERMDITIDCEVTLPTTQEFISVSPYRKLHTTVTLSVQMKDVKSGLNLFPTGMKVSGNWGLVQGEGYLLTQNQAASSAESRRAAGNDYQRALAKAMEQAVVRIGKVMRPLARVVSVNETSLGIRGGSRHGFQGGDTLVVFQAQMSPPGEKQEIIGTQPLAVIRCAGVGSESSQCDLTRIDPRYQPQVGDYAILSDRSAAGPREE